RTLPVGQRRVRGKRVVPGSVAGGEVNRSAVAGHWIALHVLRYHRDRERLALGHGGGSGQLEVVDDRRAEQERRKQIRGRPLDSRVGQARPGVKPPAPREGPAADTTG